MYGKSSLIGGAGVTALPFTGFGLAYTVLIGLTLIVTSVAARRLVRR
jgi:hypothetical protein